MVSTLAYGGQGPLMLVVIWIEFVLTTVLVALRVYAQKRYPRQTAWPLFWATLSWAFGVGTQLFITMSIAYGIGNHDTVLLQYKTTAAAMLWVWVGQCCALMSIGLGKIAAVSFILSIQGPTYPWKRRFLIALGVVNLIFDFIVLVLTWFQCSPSNALWDPNVKGANCEHVFRSLYISYATGAINAFTDVFLALYPISLLWKLRLKMTIKVGLGALMSFGVFAGLCSAIKTAELPNMVSTTDKTYAIARLVIWACTEQWIVLIVTSIPPLWPLVRPAFSNKNFYPLVPRKSNCPLGKNLSPEQGDGFQGEGKATATTKAYAVCTETDSFNDSDERPKSLPGDGILMTHNISVKHDAPDPDAKLLQLRFQRFYESGRPSVVAIRPQILKT